MGRKTFVIFICILVITFSLRFILFFQNRKTYRNGEFLTFKTTLLSQPQTVGRNQRITANVNQQKIFITTANFPEYSYGQELLISGKVKISSQNNLLTMSFPKIQLQKSSSLFSLTPILAVTSFVRQNVVFVFQKTLPPIYSSLMLGIVFGIKDQMPKNFMEQLKLSGVLHVIAASGMNVTMVAGFLSGIFAFFLRRQVALILSILGIFFYAVLAGLEPSIIRASIMGVLVFSSQIIGRQSLAVYGLFLSGFFMLFISPMLIFDVGFQLSFLATSGLLFIKPIFKSKSAMWEDMSTTTVAQAATLPILLANFGTYSLWSIAVNSLVLWTIPVLMILGGLGAILGMIFLPLGQIFLYLSFPFLLFFEKIVSFFAGFGGVIQLENFSWQFTLGYYFLLTAFVLWLRRRGEE